MAHRCSDRFLNAEALAITTRKIREGTVSDSPHFKSEEWLRLATQGSQIGLWSWDEVNKRLFWDTNTREMFGAPVDGEVDLETFYKALHPADRDRVRDNWRHAFEHGLAYELEYRSLRSDDTIRWIHARGAGSYDDAGKPLRMVGVAFDFTEQKDAEQKCFDLSGRLINAQELERTRLARELHDDFSQRLALLTNQLELVRRMIPEYLREASEQLHELQRSAREIGADLHSLSHRLHSSKLEYLGLAPAVTSYCADIGRQYGIQIKVNQKVPKTISAETALCLFRIVQEGLRNVIKHSRATKVELVLEGDNRAISLTLSDNGVGFEVSNRLASRGIGLLSMRERALMLGGSFEVLSQPTQGTQIAVIVPFPERLMAPMS